jgi:2-polyprenyl-6-methoxyphenol hydroxylase-like FAD-dependent oxidoreductase
MSATQVLIVGAGPTGLVLALWLNRLGIQFRIIDKLASPGTTSRALVVHARTLEFYRQIGLADSIDQRWLRFVAANLWVKGKKVGRVNFGAMGQGVSPFPYMLIYPQDEHERLLIDRLADVGVTIERPCELIGFQERGDRIVSRLRKPDGTEETCESYYIAGCDGAHSTVREVLGAGFPGGTYARMFYVADAQATGPPINGELHVALDDADFLAVFPLASGGRARLIGTVLQDAEAQGEALEWDDVGKVVIDRLRVNVEQVNWFSTYRVHHRVANRFRKGRAFLLGDAAHIHSPVGGQGMNTGIGDAVNLSWKLAAVLRGRSSLSILDTYEPERIAFARRLVATTDRAFTVVTSPGRFARFVRVMIAPRLLPALTSFTSVRRFMFRTLSQTALNYRHSQLSAGVAGSVHGGDRLPWVPFVDGRDNFEPLTSLDWQVHVYGECAQDITDVCSRRQLPLHTFPWNDGARRASLKRDAVYLVRPDGYVALADPTASPDKLAAYFDSRDVRPMN